MNSPAINHKRSSVFLYLGFVVVASFFTYFFNYYQPAATFWDEPYHIASAQKYLNGVYFMEQHPPLGKLLIALGEKITHANKVNNQFINTDYAKEVPAGFSYVGYRLFPALLGWLTAPLLFLVFFLITRHEANSSLLSFLYIFDNALIVHGRGAMIESTLLFLCTAMIAVFLLLLRYAGKKRAFAGLSIALGVLFGLIMTTKLVGLVMILLFPAACVFLWPKVSKIGSFFGLALLGFVVAFVGVWQIHFSLGTTLQPQLPDNGYYQASASYKTILAKHLTSSPLSFPVMIADSMKFVGHYNGGVPRLDLCKSDENGSPFFYWPFGARTINYRWQAVSDSVYRYLYLVPNAVGWLCGLVGIFACVAILFGWLFLPLKKKPEHLFLIALFTALYFGYMIAISRLDRVMYLYHYFLPLLFSYILFALAFENFHTFASRTLNEHKRGIVLTVIAICIFGCFQVYRPFTYYEAISNKQVQRRAIVPLWEMTCVNCAKKSILVVPSK